MKLSYAQRRWLEVIANQNDRGEDGSDCEGDLSVCTGNVTATHDSLIRRGLIEAEYDWDTHPEDAPWRYTVTDAGREVLKELDPASQSIGDNDG